MRSLELIDACYRIDLDATSWGELLCSVGARLLGPAFTPFCHAYEIGEHGSVRPRWLAASDRAPLLRREREVSLFYDRLNRTVAAPALSELFGVTRPVVRISDELDPELARVSQLLLPKWSWLCVFASLSGTAGILFGALSRSPIRLSARKYAMLADFSGHLAVAHELRSLMPATRLVARIAAALAPGTGTRSGCGATRGPASDRERMIDVAQSMDWGRSGRQRRSSEEALELWRAVKSSEYALLEMVDRGEERIIVALRHPGRAGLTPREAAVSRLAADGLSNKLIGAELGISASTVAVHLSTALRKLGCPNRAALVLRHRQATLG